MLNEKRLLQKNKEEMEEIVNVEQAADFLKKRGWKIHGMPGSGREPRDGLYVVLDDKGEDTGVRFEPYTHLAEKPEIHNEWMSSYGCWAIDGRVPSPDSWTDNSWTGRGWERFTDLDMALKEQEYYKNHGFDFDESPRDAGNRRYG